MWNRKTILIIVSIIIILSPLFTIHQKSPAIPYKTMSGINNVGDAATNFTLADIYGNKCTLYDFKGNIILLHVGSTGCGGCQEEAASYEKIWKLYKDKGVVVLGINVSGSVADLLDFIKHYKITHPLLHDFDFSVDHEYECYIWPHSIVIDRNMKITLRGFYLEDDLTKEIDRLLALQPPAAKKAEKPKKVEMYCDDETGICYFKPAMKNIAASEPAVPQCAQGWSEAQALTKNIGNNFAPRIVSDGKGRMWVTWYSDWLGDNEIYASYHNGKKWSPILRISEDKGDDYSPDIVLDEKGQTWITWVSNRYGNYDIFAKSFDEKRWSSIQTVTRFVEDDMQPALTVDSEGKAWAVWYTWEKMKSAFFPGKMISRDANIYISRFDGKQWSERQLISPPPEEDGSDDHFFPDVVIDGKGKLWFSWHCDYHPQRKKRPIKGAGGDTIFSRYFDGSGWSDISAASGNDDETKQTQWNMYPNIVVNDSGKIWVTYEGLRMRYPDTERRNVNRFGNRAIYVNHTEDDVWVNPTKISKNDATNVEPQIIFDQKGNPGVFWYTNKDGDWNIYESHMVDDQWTDPSAVTIGNTDDMSVSACVDASGTIWVVWHCKTGERFNIFYTTLSD